MNKRVIVGLGNPGKRHVKTRHNLGWMALDAFASAQGSVSWKFEKQWEAEVADLRMEDEKIYLLKPQTFMNESGRAVQKFLAYHRLDMDDLLVIYDDIDLDFGKMRIVSEGGAGGHNGVKSLIQALATNKFTRLKLGVRTAKRDRIPADQFVLQPFGIFERQRVKKWLPKVADAISCLLTEDEQVCMNLFH